MGPKENAGRSEFALRDMNWLIDAPETGVRCQVQIRAREVTRDAWVYPLAGGARVVLDEAAMPAPGQACVLYRDSRVLGGGFILA